MKRITLPVETRNTLLGACPLFEGLSADLVLALAHVTESRSYQPGEVLFHEGDSADGLHIIGEGQVKVCRYGPDGREHILHIFEGGEPCGEVAMFEGGTFPAAAETLAPSHTLFISRKAFLNLAGKRPDLLMNMLAILSLRLRRFVVMIEDLALKEVSTRLAQHLLDLSQQSGGSSELELTISKTMLASRLGTVAETLSRTLARMQRRGIIEVDGRRVRVLNPKALKKLAEGDKL